MRPLLFLIFINDLASNQDSLTCRYADDLKLYQIADDAEDLCPVPIKRNDSFCFRKQNESFFSSFV